MRLRSFLVLCVGLTAAEAVSRNDSSRPRQGWTDSPNKRGTIDILWSCLSTLFICIWASLHLNTPLDREPFRWIFLRKLRWGLMSALVPEIVTAFAFDQFLYSWYQSLHMRQIGYDYWTITHSFAVLMGAIALTDTNGNGCTRVEPIDFFDLASNWKLELPSASKRKELPPLDLSEIRDKSKSSNVVKTLACFQAGWLVIQCIGRRNQGLQVTTLEIITIAYTANAFLLYSLWWNKPLDIEVPIKVKADVVPLGIQRVKDSYVIPYCGWLELETRLRSEQRTVRASEILALRIHNTAKEYWIVIGLLLVAAAFGAIHVAAWNSDFASLTEKMLWRICSVATTVLPVALPASRLPPKRSLGTVLIVAAVIYSVCRCYLIVEPFVSLRSLPADAYDTIQWSNFIPHIY